MTNKMELEDTRNGQHVASMEIYNTEDGVFAITKVADEESEILELPPHIAAQLPMAINMMKSQLKR